MENDIVVDDLFRLNCKLICTKSVITSYERRLIMIEDRIQNSEENNVLRIVYENIKIEIEILLQQMRSYLLHLLFLKYINISERNNIE